MGKILSRSYQTIQHNPQTQKEPKDVIVWEKVPKRRKWWRAWLFSIFICLSCAIGIIYHGFAERKITEYKPVSDLSTSTKLEAIKNGSIECYTKEEKISYTVFVNLGLGLLAIMLGTLVDRLSLVFEELFHFKRRYNRSICKMLKACFSGISLGAAGVVFVIVVISIAVPLATKSTFDLKHATYILSGIGVGPLVMHLLNLTQSEVHISTILEEKETYVAHGLAWSYYFNYLDNALPKFEEKFPNNSSGIPVQDQGQQVRLSLNKLILLISHDCMTVENLETQDNKITKLGEIRNGKHIFPVYRLTYNNTERRYVIKYVMQPLETLQKMSLYERIPSFHEKELEYQVKFFFKTLSDILKKPFNNKHREKCILVPIKAESSKSLNNGGLVHFIMHKVTEDQSTSDQENGFMMVPPAKKTLKTEDDASALDGKTVGLPSSHTVDIDPVEGTAHYSKQKEDRLSSIDSEDENSAIFHPVEERGNRCESKQLQRQYGKSCQSERETMLHNDYEKHAIHVDVHNNPSQAGESKGTQTISGSHSMSSNLENGRENSPREDEYEESDFTCDSPLIPNGTGETENTSMSSTADRRENCLREDADNAGPAPSYNPPVSDHTGENEDQPTSAYVHDGGENSPRREEDTTSMSSPSIVGRAEL